MSKHKSFLDDIPNRLDETPFFSEAPQKAPQPVDIVAKPEEINSDINKDISGDINSDIKKDIRISSNQEIYDASLIEIIRKSVKSAGKEQKIVRFSAEEKELLKSTTYECSKYDPNFNETDICRIATKFILEDYQLNKESSLLVKVIQALIA